MGVVSQSLFNGSGEHPPSGWAEGPWRSRARAYLQPATEESIPPVAMVTEPSAGKGGRVSERASQRDVLYRKRGGGGGRRGEDGAFDTSHNFDDPPPVCLPTDVSQQGFLPHFLYEFEACSLQPLSLWMWFEKMQRRAGGEKLWQNAAFSVFLLFRLRRTEWHQAAASRLCCLSKDDSRQQLTCLFCSCVTGHTVSTNWK